MTDTLSPLQFEPFERKAGQVGPHRESHEPRLDLSKFVTPGAVVTVPPSWDGTHGIVNWGMDGNDQWGDCGAAMADHYNVAAANSTALVGTLGQPVYSGTLPTYWAYGLDQGETGTPPAQPDQPDQGVDNSTWCGFLYKKGILRGYGEVPPAQIREYAFLFGGLYMGVQLSSNAQAQFEATPPVPWGQPGDTPDPTMGHDVLFIGFTEDGGGLVITWGAVQRVTADFLANFVTDVWAPLDLETAKEAGFDSAALLSALTDIHGVVTPPAPAAPPVESESFIEAVQALYEKSISDLKGAIAKGEAEIARLEAEIAAIERAYGAAAGAL